MSRVIESLSSYIGEHPEIVPEIRPILGVLLERMLSQLLAGEDRAEGVIWEEDFLIKQWKTLDAISIMLSLPLNHKSYLEIAEELEPLLGKDQMWEVVISRCSAEEQSKILKQQEELQSICQAIVKQNSEDFTIAQKWKDARVTQKLKHFEQIAPDLLPLIAEFAAPPPMSFRELVNTCFFITSKREIEELCNPQKNLSDEDFGTLSFNLLLDLNRKIQQPEFRRIYEQLLQQSSLFRLQWIKQLDALKTVVATRGMSSGLSRLTDNLSRLPGNMNVSFGSIARAYAEAYRRIPSLIQNPSFNAQLNDLYRKIDSLFRPKTNSQEIQQGANTPITEKKIRQYVLQYCEQQPMTNLNPHLSMIHATLTNNPELMQQFTTVLASPEAKQSILEMFYLENLLAPAEP